MNGELETSSGSATPADIGEIARYATEGRQPITNKSGYEISALGDAVRQALPDYGRVEIVQLPAGDGYRVEVRR